MSGQLLAAFLATAHPWSAEVTGYCPCAICCEGSADGVTASGAKAEGKLAAADKAIPFGTLIYVPGYSESPVPVLDRGGAIKGNKLDLLFPTHAQAAKWGRRMMTVWISIRPPDANEAAKAGHSRWAGVSPAKTRGQDANALTAKTHGQDARAMVTPAPSRTKPATRTQVFPDTEIAGNAGRSYHSAPQSPLVTVSLEWKRRASLMGGRTQKRVPLPGMSITSISVLPDGRHESRTLKVLVCGQKGDEYTVLGEAQRSRNDQPVMHLANRGESDVQVQNPPSEWDDDDPWVSIHISDQVGHRRYGTPTVLHDPAGFCDNDGG
jgi:3D (Asp-Asp-Asp) domain-containing protein